MRISSVFLLCLCICSSVSAHKLAPSLLELTELPGGVIGLMWRTPLVASKPPDVVLPASCETMGSLDKSINATAAEQRYSLLCSKSTSDLEFALSGLSASRSAALVRWYGLDGEEQQQLLAADEDTFSPQNRDGRGLPILQFTGLGVKHILIGADHLLFVLGLLLVAKNRYRLFVWISAFTVGHSVTLLLVSIGVIPRWPALTEWLIAASVLIMALWAERNNDKYSGKLSSKRFTLLIGVFGLLHGLGFASVLEELSVPSGEMLPALLGFNIGIELGQILFITVVLCAVILANRLLQMWPHAQLRCAVLARLVAVYLMGSIASFWMIDRGLILLEATFLGVY
ncbi:HupE/UreJ family protein [Zhongshania sp. BJYM1]|uniref:HupE/UreJ family protein n=1 Tax=Zhongshania aquatica TaxID=2965069 RepID=UPI0022B47AE4|nr:HupE/UreJ family protein [Marortus sp. BJYM1]